MRTQVEEGGEPSINLCLLSLYVLFVPFLPFAVLFHSSLEMESPAILLYLPTVASVALISCLMTELCVLFLCILPGYNPLRNRRRRMSTSEIPEAPLMQEAQTQAHIPITGTVNVEAMSSFSMAEERQSALVHFSLDRHQQTLLLFLFPFYNFFFFDTFRGHRTIAILREREICRLRPANPSPLRRRCRNSRRNSRQRQTRSLGERFLPLPFPFPSPSPPLFYEHACQLSFSLCSGYLASGSGRFGL